MKVRLEAVHPQADGEYELDIDTLTNRDFHLIKTKTGVRAGELEESLLAGDLDVVLAFALIALLRADKPAAIEEALWNAPAGSIQLDFADGDEPVPLDSEQNSSSGESKSTSGESSES